MKFQRTIHTVAFSGNPSERIEVELDIDIDGLLVRMGRTAHVNSSKRAQFMHGLIKAAIKKVPQ